METFDWVCPACGDFKITRLSKAALELAILLHIQAHERTAARRAVDAARQSCTSSYCEIGNKKTWDPSVEKLTLDLTTYDRSLLQDLKIKWEG